MPRKKKTDKEIGRFPETIMKEAVKLVVEGGQSVRQAAKQKGLAFQTLSRYVKKYKEDDTVKLCPNYRVNLIFPAELEQLLYDYLVQCSKMFYGLTLLDCRQLAYELAIKNNLNIPESWQTQKLASVDWMKGFRKRFPNLSLRTPEGCSLSRATGFNRFNVDTFFDKLEEVLLRHPNFGNGLRVYNLDETGTLTVQKSSKVLALKGSKQVNKATSAERGTLVTTCCIVNAQGNSIPPVMIFPRVHFKEHMTLGAPNGTLGLATKGGWMNSECFIQVVEHFIKHTSSSKDNPTLLIMDNHESHLSIEVIDLCKANGITILTIPPHCTNKLQPLDVGILKPFHTFYDAAIDSWMMSHPGETFSIYNVASCVGIAYPRAMTPNNITNAFKKCGIFPFDRHTFTADDFLPSSITDREQSASNITQVSKSPGLSGATNTDSLSIPPESSSELPISPDACSILQPSKSPGPSPNPQPFISPTDIRGYPKAKPRKSSNRCGRKGKTRIATDTPEKLELEKKRKLKEIKKKPTKKRLFRAHIEEESDVDEPEPEVVLQDSSGDEAIESFIEEQEQDPVIFFEDLQREPVPGDYILVEFKSKEKIYYVGEVVSKPDPDSPEFEVKFMRKSSKCFGKFIFPAVQDLAVVPQGDIKTILPKPTAHGSTKRQQAYLSFEINLDSFDVR